MPYGNTLCPVSYTHLSELTLALYNKCAAYALERGIIIGGIYTGIFTPTEAAAVGTVYALAITRCV